MRFDPRFRRRPAAFAMVALATLGFTLGLAAPAHAHHGRDFLLVQTAELPHGGDGYFIARQDYIETEKGHEIELEPTLFVGVTDRFALELHSHVAKEGDESFTYESTAPAFTVRLTPGHAEWGLGLSGEYEISHHDEHPDRAEGRLLASGRLGRGTLAVNLIAGREQESGADVEWAYAAGYRFPVSRRLAWGLEGEGGFQSGDTHELLLGIYAEPNARFTINAGVGTGVGGGESPDLTVRTAVVVKLW